MYCYFVAKTRSLGPHITEEKCVFWDADTMFKWAIIGMLRDGTIDSNVMMSTGKRCGTHWGQIWGV